MGETVAEKKRGRPGKAEPVVAKKAKTVVAPVEEGEEEEEAPAAAAPAKRGRGRPPKNGVKAMTPKKPSGRGRGRPPKNAPAVEEKSDEEEAEE